ncbi:MAG TPA: helix-turn-helix domain-containing protein [Ktedonobacterales bacterium]|nr:helix-turn-helix domain-containing protein [Ktedonobacterales bacterium]
MQDWLKKFPKLSELSDLLGDLPITTFGERLREFRTLRGKSIDDLAAEVEIPPSVLRDMESGARPAPSKGTIFALAAALHLDKLDRATLLEAAELSSSTLRKLAQKDKTSAQPAFTAAILVFLIADIRGYTRYTQEHGDAAAARLTTRFSELANSVAEQHDGRVIEVRGDEVLAVFASARQALLAAHMLQARCAAEAEAHPDLPLAIGIGLDVGEPIPMEGGGYRGAALNRAARLCSLAGPGDVLVTTGVAHIAPQVDGVTYVHRGSEELKGIAGPTPVLQAARTEVLDPGE